jgi:NADPH2:quinone reductase
VSDYKAEEARRVWGEIIDWMGRIGARPVIDSVFRFDQLREAFARLAEGPLGKVLMEVSPEGRSR